MKYTLTDVKEALKTKTATAAFIWKEYRKENHSKSIIALKKKRFLTLSNTEGGEGEGGLFATSNQLYRNKIFLNRFSQLSFTLFS